MEFLLKNPIGRPKGSKKTAEEKIKACIKIKLYQKNYRLQKQNQLILLIKRINFKIKVIDIANDENEKNAG
jgi:hypothetical protein